MLIEIKWPYYGSLVAWAKYICLTSLLDHEQLIHIHEVNESIPRKTFSNNTVMSVLLPPPDFRNINHDVITCLFFFRRAILCVQLRRGCFRSDNERHWTNHFSSS